MKVIILCLFMLAFAAHAERYNWAGKYISALGDQHNCAPRGVVTVTQDDTKGTIKGKWDPFSAACKEFEAADQAFENNEGVLTDDTLTFTLKSKNETTIKIEFYKDKDEPTIKVGFNNTDKTSVSGKAEKKSDQEIEETKTLLGSYKFKLTEGEASKCCFPASLEVVKHDTAVIYTSGKWENSEGCKSKSLGDVAWEKTGAISTKNAVQWSVIELLAYGIIQVPDDKKPEEITFTYTAIQGCKISATRTPPKSDDDNKWWIWLIVGIVAALVIGGIVGYVVYNKKKNANSQRTPLMNA